MKHAVNTYNFTETSILHMKQSSRVFKSILWLTHTVYNICISQLYSTEILSKTSCTPLNLSTSVTLLRTSLEWRYHGDWTVLPVKQLFTFQQILFSSRETSTHHREQRYSLWTGPARNPPPCLFSLQLYFSIHYENCTNQLWCVPKVENR